MSNTPADEVPDVQLLAAIDRAERHKGNATKGVPVWEVLAHLELATRSRRARHVRELLVALAASGSLQHSRRRGVTLWALTSSGRRLSRARRANRVPPLPESPQHRKWREAHTLAEQRIEGFCFELRDAVEHARQLLDALAPRPAADPPGVAPGLSSDVWFELAEQLQRAARRLGSASYCLWEWREPDDARADLDDLSDPYDRAFDPKRRAVRRARRGGRRNTRLWDAARELAFLGRAIGEAREQHELSVAELAGNAGIPARRLARLEAGQLDPAYDLLLKLADALSTSPSTFVARAQELETKEQSR